ncbi:MAG: alpha/beta fold hydrolase [Candidatus Gastranaerophilales bacterium]|nr:alpha/beta fold hydrolase [Candidatus Gastranaerophilales bacterium]
MSSKDGFQLKHSENKKAVLLFHGMTGSPFEMRHYAKYLHRAGYDVYCSCLPGHGGQFTDLKKTRWQEWQNYAINEFDYLKNSYEEVYIAGLCMGALLALSVAEQGRDVAGITGLSTTLYLDGWTLPWYKIFFPLGLYTVLKFFYDFPESDPYGIKNEVVRKKISSLYHENTVALDCIPMTCILELIRFSKHIRKNIKKVKVPFIVIHSKDDDLTSTKSAKFVYNNASSEIKEYIELDNSYHLIVIDNEKKFVADKSIEFFNKLSKFNDQIIQSVEEAEILSTKL